MTVLVATSLLWLPGRGVGQPSQPQPKGSACSLHVAITDEDGKALPKAFVFIHNERGTNRQVAPDREGEVKISLHSGMYDMFVSATGFVPQAQIVDLRACKPVDLNLTLAIDSEHADNDGL